MEHAKIYACNLCSKLQLVATTHRQHSLLFVVYHRDTYYQKQNPSNFLSTIFHKSYYLAYQFIDANHQIYNHLVSV